jgi:hypothetical protein
MAICIFKFVAATICWKQNQRHGLRKEIKRVLSSDYQKAQNKKFSLDQQQYGHKGRETLL